MTDNHGGNNSADAVISLDDVITTPRSELVPVATINRKHEELRDAKVVSVSSLDAELDRKIEFLSG
jgi:hypothetical protein